MAAGSAPTNPVRARGTPLWGGLRRLVVQTTAACFRYRVTGLAAEAGFFALLSLPPLILGIAGSLGYLTGILGNETVAQVRAQIIDFARTFLTERSVQDVIVPTLQSVFDGGRFDIISIGFVLSLWSGSRALNVYVDTITIMYGQAGRRGIIRTRALSFSLYTLALLIGAVVMPLVLAGPSAIDQMLPPSWHALTILYWPVVTLLSVAALTSLYHLAVPIRAPWRRDIPGALLALTIWVAGSFVVRDILRVSVGGPSIYGPLATPIVVMIWLYVLAIAVLIGAALNAAVGNIWPHRRTAAEVQASSVDPAKKPLTPLPGTAEQLPGAPQNQVTREVADR